MAKQLVNLDTKCKIVAEVQNPPWAQRAHDLCKSRTETITRMMGILNDLAGKEHHQQSFEALEERIFEMPLSVEVRSDWVEPRELTNRSYTMPVEYRILLSTGGPATQIIGTLDEHGEPEQAYLQAQDWFEPWTNGYSPSPHEALMLLSFARTFYYGG